jgi:hypothetical protein
MCGTGARTATCGGITIGQTNGIVGWRPCELEIPNLGLKRFALGTATAKPHRAKRASRG